MDPGTRWFRRLLKVLPADFRAAYGREMERTFRAQHRDARGVHGVSRLWLETLIDLLRTAPREHVDVLRQDVTFAWRLLTRSPVFAATAVVTLTLGIGANTAIFTVVDGVLLRPLPYVEPDRLLKVTGTDTRSGKPGNLSRPDFIDYAAASTLESAGAHLAGIGAFSLTGSGDPERVRAVNVSAGFFEVLRTRPFLGRLTTSDDDAKDADVVVMSHGLWQRRFGGDPGIVGRPILLGDLPNEVIGILPADFRYPQPDGLGEPELYAPMILPGQNSRSGRHIRAIARMNPGVTLEQTRTELSAIASRLQREYPQDNHHESIDVRSLLDAIVGDTRPALVVLTVAVGLVLLVACANLANLLLARGIARGREMAVRAALGASVVRIVRQVVTESLLLAAIGGTAGVALAYGGTNWLIVLAGPGLPRPQDITVNARSVAFTAIVALGTGVLFGLVPAWHARRLDLLALLKSAAPGSIRPLQAAVRKALIAAQVAVCATLLVGASLLVQTLWRVMSVDPGFVPAEVLSFQMALPLARYPEGTQIPFYEELYGRIERHAGVRAVAGINILPLSGNYSCDGIQFPDKPVPRGQEPCAEARSVSLRYFQVMGIPLRRGRIFDDRDDARGSKVAMINQAMAARYWPGQDPIGRRFLYFSRGETEPREIVGVVGDTKHLDLRDDAPAQFYTPQRQQPSYRGMTVVIRTAQDPTAAARAAREELRALDTRIPIYNVRTLDALIDRVVARPRLQAWLLSTFALFAVVLAAVGVYGVVAWVITQRTREIGLRIALGATPREIVSLVVAQGMAPVAGGLVAGILAAVVLARSMQALLFGVTATDPLVYAASLLVLAAIGLAACYIPARAATRVDPVAALRTE
jgi:putative ABC transport system permease protein